MYAKTRLGKSAIIFAVALLMLTLIIPVSAVSEEPQYIDIYDETPDNSHYASGESYSFSICDVQKFRRDTDGLGLLIHRDIGDITRIIFGSSEIITTSPDRIDQTSVDFYYNPSHTGTSFPTTIDRTHYVGSGTIYIYSNSETNEGHMSFIMDNWDSSAYKSHPNEQVFCHAELSRNLNFSTIQLRKLPSQPFITDGNVAALRTVAGSRMVTTIGDPTYVYTKGAEFRQKITYYKINNDFNAVEVSRVVDDDFYQSTVTVLSQQKNEPYFVDDTNSNTVVSWFPANETPYDISVYSPLTTKSYNYTVFGGDDPDDPDESGITVYIKNSQTGALIADANIAIDALVDGEYYPVTNRTEPSGIFTITLQQTGGGKPNPDGYRLIVTADGYNNPMPEINFTLGDYRKYFECFLDPIAGGPADENKTFIDFFVRDMSSNPISGATVKFGKYTLITNSAGYTVFEVDKNNNYTWTVSKSGYGSLTGNAVIGADPRHTINTVLAPIVTPTVTTPIPTSPPIGPTPTMTAPTGEPVSNWLEWFAAHFGMILGGGVEIGKIFMWLCFTVPVGVYVGKEAKAGAAGFMAGAGIVTLFFVLIGWVPIWLVVLLALIIGLLYAKVFNTQDNGGGR